ncbi:MAG: hypothetical protein MJ063_01190 [Lachnospiraceae bacterium]|nr:hypothetical protein [Lachnospiraceae bacterium]
MAILMTPFLSIAVMLVDTGRYNSAVSVLQETMDMAALSTLAEEDPYLRDRWGLHAIDYRKEISEEFEKNLRDNNLLGSTISIDKVSAEGLLDLSDSDIFAHQIEEFSKLNAPTELLFEFGNIKDLIDELGKLNNFSSILNIFSSAVNWLTSLLNLFTSVVAAEISAEVMEGADTLYEPTYKAFKNSVNTLIDALNAPEPVQEDFTDEEGNPDEEAYEEALEEWREAIRDAREDAKAAQAEYSELILVFANATQKYSESIAEVSGGVTDVLSDSVNIAKSVGQYENDKSEDELNKVKGQLKGMSGQEPNYKELKAREKELTDKVAIDKTALTTAKSLSKEMESTANSIKDKFSRLSKIDYGVTVKGLKKLRERVDAFDVDAVCAGDEGLSDEIYHDVASPEYLTSSEISLYLADRTKEALEGVWKDIIDGIKGLFEALFKTKLVFDTNLNRLIDYDYYTDAIGGLPGGQGPGKVEAVINGINSTIEAYTNIVTSWFTFNIIRLIENLINLIKSVIATFEALLALVVYMLQNLADLLTNTGHRLLLSTYSAYNLTCRTDFTSGHTAFTAMNGYKMTDESLPPNVFASYTGNIVADQLSELIKLLTNAVSGEESNKSYTFSGAELEYMLYGSRSEIANQTFVFFALYLLRFALDIGPVLADSEVQALAEASTLAAPAVLAIFLFVEPLTDALLLVNGSEVSLLKSDVNISPSGFPKLLAKFIKTVALTAETKEKLEKEAVKAFNAKDADYEKKLNEATEKEKKKLEADPPKSDFSKGIGNWLDSLLEFNYREYCFMLVFLLISSDLCVSRLENLVQMETTYYYKVYEEDEKTFDLKKSYTFLKGTMDGKVNQLLPSLIKPELFNTSQEIYRGY